MREVDCGERDAGRRGDRTVGKGTGNGLGESDAGEGTVGNVMWGENCGDRTVGKEMQGRGGDCGEWGGDCGEWGVCVCLCVCVYVCACMHVLCV